MAVLYMWLGPPTTLQSCSKVHLLKRNNTESQCGGAIHRVCHCARTEREVSSCVMGCGAGVGGVHTSDVKVKDTGLPLVAVSQFSNFEFLE